MSIKIMMSRLNKPGKSIDVWVWDELDASQKRAEAEQVAAEKGQEIETTLALEHNIMTVTRTDEGTPEEDKRPGPPKTELRERVEAMSVGEEITVRVAYRPKIRAAAYNVSQDRPGWRFTSWTSGDVPKYVTVKRIQ